MAGIKFTDNEINRLNLIENDSMREKLWSFYGFLLNSNYWRTVKAIQYDYGNKDFSYLTLSNVKISKAYFNATENKVSHVTIGIWLDKLEQVGLVKIEKNKFRAATIYFTRFGIKEEIKANIKEQNSVESVKKSNDDDDDNTPHNHPSNNNINNTYSTDCESVDYGDVVSKDELEVEAKKEIKRLGLRSHRLIKEVLDSLRACKKAINKRGMKKYISAVIISKKAILEAERERFAKRVSQEARKINNFIGSKQLKCANFTQREYDWNDLESQLLAHY